MTNNPNNLHPRDWCKGDGNNCYGCPACLPAPPPPAMTREQMIVKLEGIESVLAPLAAGFTPGTRGALADARSVLAALRAPTPADLVALVRTRIKISEDASQEAAANRDKALADYHNGCIGMGLCLLDDLAELAPPALGTPLAAEAATENGQ